ncbi:flavin reductase [Plantibacter sp. RU18]|uniref:flavin reductase n=1 Tax=Plantibacter sp. RU18 TaxID=3158143 RepID=UPI003D364A3E
MNAVSYFRQHFAFGSLILSFSPQSRAGHRKRTLSNHTIIDPAILYFGTPVALLSSIDHTGKSNTAPMSSIFWLGQTALLGMGARSLTAQNLLDTGECVINLPTVDLVTAVDTLALTTGRSPVPPKQGASRLSA